MSVQHNLPTDNSPGSDFDLFLDQVPDNFLEFLEITQPSKFKQQFFKNPILEINKLSTSTLIDLLSRDTNVSEYEINDLLQTINGLHFLYKYEPIVLQKFKIPASIINTISITKELMRRSTEQSFPTPPMSIEKINDYLKPLTIHMNDEIFGILCLNATGQVLSNTTIAIGNSNGVSINTHAIFKTALIMSASAIVIYHNHPNEEVPTVSNEDIKLTKALLTQSKVIDIIVMDHVIITDKETIQLKNTHPHLWDEIYQNTQKPIIQAKPEIPP